MGIKDLVKAQENNMKKPIAIVYSDLHSHIWKQYNMDGVRNVVPGKVLKLVSDLCIKHNVPAIFTGDMYHGYDDLPAESVIDTMAAYKEYFENPKILHFAISGNHDYISKNSYEFPSKSHLHTFSKVFNTFKLLDYSVGEVKGLTLFGIPYNNGNVDLKKFLRKYSLRENKAGYLRVLLIHTDWPGAKDTSGYEIGSYDNVSDDINKYLKGFDLILCGHIHKHQVLGKLIMVGAPNQQRISDINNKMGVLILYSDKSVELVEVPGIPKFVEYRGNKPIGTDMYVKVEDPLPEEEVEIQEYTSISNPKKVGKAYLKHRGIKSKSKKRTLLELL